MEVQLTIQQPDGVTTDHRFDEEPITIGSAIANHIIFEDPQLAPHQLIIFRERGVWVIRNLARGFDLVCNHEFLEPGTTMPLPVQASIQMGSYHIEWFSEAPPQDAARDFARPMAPEEKVTRGRVERGDEAAAIHQGNEENGPLRSPRKRTEAGNEANADPRLVHQVGGISEPTDHPEDRLAPMPSGDTARSIARSEAASAPILPRDADPDDLESMRQAIANVIGSPDGQAPTEASLPESVAEEHVAEAPAGPPHSRPAPARTGADPFADDLAPSSGGTDERIGVVGFRMMNPMRAYPFQVNVQSQSGAGGVVRVIPTFPGCSVSPTSVRIDATRGQGGAKFWVTPIAVGKHDDACMDMVWQGSRPVRLKIPCRIASYGASKLWAFLGAMCGGAAILVYRGRWKVMDQLERALPSDVFAKVNNVIGELGGPVNCCLLLAILFMIGALLAIFLGRPRKLRLVAKRP